MYTCVFVLVVHLSNFVHTSRSQGASRDAGERGAHGSGPGRALGRQVALLGVPTSVPGRARGSQVPGLRKRGVMRASVYASKLF